MEADFTPLNFSLMCAILLKEKAFKRRKCKKKRFKRIISVLLVLGILCSFAFAAGFANHPGHQWCHEKNCLICSQLKAAGELLDGMNRLAVVGLTLGCLVLFGRTVTVVCTEKRKEHGETPVSLKVKILS